MASFIQQAFIIGIRRGKDVCDCTRWGMMRSILAYWKTKWLESDGLGKYQSEKEE